MRIRWRGLELPSRLECDEAVSTATYGKFLVEPFERGFGTTIGNSLRRILLSSLNGAAVYAVKIANAPHEYSTLPGVLEDVADIILNIKSLVVQMEGEGDETRILKIARSGAGEITAGDLECETGVTVVNPDLKLVTVTEDVNFEMELRAKRGRGYATAEDNSGPEQEVGVIPIDSIFSPVTRVRYRTEDTRVGQRTNYDRLVLEIWTRGSVEPVDAVVEAGKILRKHLNPFVLYRDAGSSMVSTLPAQGEDLPSGNEEINSLLNRSVADLQLSVRAANCLESARLRTIGELVSKTESDLLRVRSFGKTSLHEVKRKLSELGLGLGMTFGEHGEPIMHTEHASYGDDDLDDLDDHEGDDGGDGGDAGDLGHDPSMSTIVEGRTDV
ncbi:MAG TPA: DNA-directed RNA polymerase subunit alpha [Phycisphaerae bacterium]|nr:DNA-directed RNA polymerase subunit alpha [Phycisphaerales bacterium]HRX86772.1 DNA-directed RNA polymerase subunit alpha [Phycisphaerae bacterium]